MKALRSRSAFCLSVACISSALLSTANAYSFISKSTKSKRHGTSQRKRTGLASLKAIHDAPITEGDRVLVIGATGGVGQLVTKKLRKENKYNVRITSRDEIKASSIIDDDAVEVMELDLIDSDFSVEQGLAAAMDDVSAVVIATGTTAFPTKKWAGGNTPHAVDEEAVRKVAKAAAKVDTMKKVVLVTSIGVERKKELPFSILNLFGVLDAKRNGEVAVIEAASEGGFDYAIVRPGRLVGGPYTNLDVAKLLQIEGGAENGVTVEPGDTLVGDCKRDACAEAVVQCLHNGECKNLEFAIVSNEDEALTNEQWVQQFIRMQTM